MVDITQDYSLVVVQLGNQRHLHIFGGIGSGKSTLGAFFAELGATLIEADIVGHRVIASGGTAFEAVAARWPQVVVDGEIDRAALGRVVFGDTSALAQLESLVHPSIKADIESSLGQVPADGVAVLEAAVTEPLVDRPWQWVLVEAPHDVRMARLRKRGLTTAEALARIGNQPRHDEWHTRADWVVPNSGSSKSLRAAAASLWDRVCQ